MVIQALDVVHIFFDEKERRIAEKEVKRFERIGYWLDCEDDGMPKTDHCFEVKRVRDVPPLKAHQN